MRESTTIRLASGTRDDLRRLADADGLTLDEEIARLLRAERQRRMGAALASATLTEDDRRWLDLSAATVVDDATR
jgi:hypothetical protein